MARTKLGPLALEARLGDAHSHVWRAVHMAQRKNLVVKIFSTPFKPTTAAKQELAHEWETLKSVRSEAIARCFGGGFEENDAYLAYEWLDGETLEQLVVRRERLPWDLVLDYADQLAEGLNAAHDRQVFHGALEPDKLMCMPGGTIKILDLRTSRFESPFRSNRPPTLQQLAFRPPELMRRDLKPSVKSDLYSLGAVLFYAVTGIPPFQASDAEMLLASINHERPPKVASLVLDCPIWFSALIEHLLEKDPSARPHGAAAVRMALQEVRRRSAEGTAVADHAARGFSPLKIDADRGAARQLLGRAEQELDKAEESHEVGSIFERWWFLLGSLLVIIGLIVWAVLPPSPDKLRRGAESLLASEDWTDWKRAQSDYLEPLLRRAPDGPHASWAQERIDEIEMRGAEAQLDLKLRRGVALRNEAERLYAEAKRFEQFGDPETALDKYHAMVHVLDEKAKIALHSFSPPSHRRDRSPGDGQNSTSRTDRTQTKKRRRIDR